MLADGVSVIDAPLVSHDTERAIAVCRACGGQVTIDGSRYVVRGVGGDVGRTSGDRRIDVGNSGTTLRLFTAIAALSAEEWLFDGDEQIRTRPMEPLLRSLADLGAQVRYQGATGRAPFTLRGPLRGGRTRIECRTSQYLTALLFAAPCAPHDTTIVVDRLEERPYIDMTLQWLERCGISYERRDDLHYRIPGGQRYNRFDYRVEGDYSSATFFLCAAALVGRGVHIENLPRQSAQGDRRVVDLLRRMGVEIIVHDNAVIVPARRATGAGDGLRGALPGPVLRGGRFDLNSIPDALPAVMVCACLADRPVVLHNVAHARIKETDRIAVMSAELRKMGARITEHLDGVTVYPSGRRLRGARLNGHGDHRVVMALSVAALVAIGTTVITDAEAAAITYPNFFADLQHLTAKKSILLP